MSIVFMPVLQRGLFMPVTIELSLCLFAGMCPFQVAPGTPAYSSSKTFHPPLI